MVTTLTTVASLQNTDIASRRLTYLVIPAVMSQNESDTTIISFPADFEEAYLQSIFARQSVKAATDIDISDATMLLSLYEKGSGQNDTLWRGQARILMGAQDVDALWSSYFDKFPPIPIYPTKTTMIVSIPARDSNATPTAQFNLWMNVAVLTY